MVVKMAKLCDTTPYYLILEHLHRILVHILIGNTPRPLVDQHKHQNDDDDDDEEEEGGKKGSSRARSGRGKQKPKQKQKLKQK